MDDDALRSPSDDEFEQEDGWAFDWTEEPDQSLSIEDWDGAANENEVEVSEEVEHVAVGIDPEPSSSWAWSWSFSASQKNLQSLQAQQDATKTIAPLDSVAPSSILQSLDNWVQGDTEDNLAGTQSLGMPAEASTAPSWYKSSLAWASATLNQFDQSNRTG